MAPGGLYQPVTFAANSAQRAKQRGIGFFSLVTGVCLIAFSGRAGSGAGTAALIIVGLLFVALSTLAIRRAHTVIDAEGISTSGPWGRRTCRWADVTDVELKIDANDGPPMVYSIKVHRRGGGSFTLPAPTDSETGDKHDNPDFQQQLAVINSYWRNGAGPPPQGR